MKISSVSNKYVKELLELKKNKVKKQKQEFLVDGLDFIDLAYEKGLLKKLLVVDYLPQFSDIEQIEVSKEILEKLSSNITTSSFIGICAYPINNDECGKHLVYLDGVQDPGNVGTIIRTALAFNYDGVVLSEDSASIYNDKVISSTKGAIFKLPIYSEISLEELKQKNYQIISSALKNSINYSDAQSQDKFVLVLGSEGQGIKNSTLQISDIVVKIPMFNIDSLNVGVAAGILMNHFRKDLL